MAVADLVTKGLGFDGVALFITQGLGDFGVTAYNLDADPSAFVWTATDVDLIYTPVASADRPSGGINPRQLDPARVRAKYEEIDAIERRIRAKEEAERETVKKIEQEKRTLAELEEKKRQTKTIAARRRKIEARIAQEEAELRAIGDLIAELVAEIEQLREALEAQQQMADRRRRMVLLLAAAAT